MSLIRYHFLSPAILISESFAVSVLTLITAVAIAASIVHSKLGHVYSILGALYQVLELYNSVLQYS